MTPATLAQVQALFAADEQQRRFWESHWAEFQRAYPDEFVAVHEGRVIAHGKDLLTLRADVEAQGIAITAASVEFIPVTITSYLL